MLIEALKKVDKRKRYLIQSALAGVVVTAFGLNYLSLQSWVLSLIFLAYILIGTFILHYPNTKVSNIIPSILLPLGILMSGYLALRTYPNFGLPLKALVVAYVCIMYYLVSLMDNIFLVVYERDESIPLYRVATSWSQIFQILVAIPLFASILKLDVVSYEQMALIVLLSFVALMHQIWIQSFDNETKRVGVGEMIFLSLFGSFLVGVGTISASYFPAEGFLHGLLSASILLFALNYVIGYLKNDISKRFIVQYLLIIMVFFGFLVFFTT